jgi:hypothetical protein
MSRFEIIMKERGRPVLIAKSEELKICVDKFRGRYNEKYRGEKDVNLKNI